MGRDHDAVADPLVRVPSHGWTLTVPDTDRALGIPAPGGDPSRPSRGADRAGRRILRAVGLAGVLAVVISLTVPIPRTVDLDGQLVPERVVSIRAEEPGLITEIHVAAGDTVLPGQLVARLRSPELDEATRTSTSHDPALLARRARLDLYAPPWSERQPDGTADPSTFWRGGIVLTEDMDERRGRRVDAGDTVVELAALDGGGEIGHVVRAWASERDAQRVHPGMPARITFTAVAQDRPRQATATVRRMAVVPDSSSEAFPFPGAGRWRVELVLDDEVVVESLTGASVEVVVQEHRETLARTAARWIQARSPKPRSVP